MTETRGTYFCVDVEANGPVPGLYDMVSLAAVVVAPGASGRLELGATLYLELKPVAPRFKAEAARIHGLDQARLAREGLDHRAACLAMSDFVRAHTRPGSEAVFVGHNAPFDWSMVAWLFAEQELENPWGYKALCTKAMAAGTLGIHWLDTSKSVLAERLALPAEDPARKHDADYDAWYQAHILIGLLEYGGATGGARASTGRATGRGPA